MPIVMIAMIGFAIAGIGTGALSMIALLMVHFFGDSSALTGEGIGTIFKVSALVSVVCTGFGAYMIKKHYRR
jgi:hypothetical protein